MDREGMFYGFLFFLGVMGVAFGIYKLVDSSNANHNTIMNKCIENGGSWIDSSWICINPRKDQ